MAGNAIVTPMPTTAEEKSGSDDPGKPTSFHRAQLACPFAPGGLAYSSAAAYRKFALARSRMVALVFDPVRFSPGDRTLEHRVSGGSTQAWRRPGGVSSSTARRRCPEKMICVFRKH